MFRITRLALLFVSLFIVSAVSAQAQSLDGRKVGYMNLNKVFDEYAKTKEYDAALEAKSKDFEKERNAKVEALRDMQAKLEALKEDERNKQQAEIDKRIAELRDYDRQKKTDLTKERDEKIREILLEIEKTVSDYAKKENYALIVNYNALIYGDNATYDVTDKVLGILNASYPKKK